MRVVIAVAASTVLLAVSCKDEPKTGEPAAAVVAPAPGAALAPAPTAALVGPEAPATACPPGEKSPAVIEVTVGGGLEQATLYFDGTATSTLGKVRSFESPEICRGKDYTYTMQFRWAGGQSDPKIITVRGGETAKVTMP